MTRPEGSIGGVVTCPSDIALLLRSKKEMRFQLPWLDGDFFNKFWVGLVGKDRNRRGWLSDTVRNYYSIINYGSLISICRVANFWFILFMISNCSTSMHGLCTSGTLDLEMLIG